MKKAGVIFTTPVLPGVFIYFLYEPPSKGGFFLLRMAFQVFISLDAFYGILPGILS